MHRLRTNFKAAGSAFFISTVLSMGFVVAAQGSEGTPPDTATPTETVTETSTPTETVTPTPTETVAPTPTETVTPTPTETVTPPPPPTPGWGVEQFTLADGRSYYARIPTCAPLDAVECTSYLGKKRQVMVFLHGFGGREDAEGARTWLEYLAVVRPVGDTVFVFGVSKDGSRAWNAGYCCSFDATDDVGYLVRAVGDLATRTTLNSARVGLLGLSNGGMMALRGACERPDVFDAGISWAGTYGGACGGAGVKVAQLHGALDKVVPVNGGSSVIGGRSVVVPPATDLAARMATGNAFPLTVLPGFGHFPNNAIQVLMVRWLAASLTG